MFNYTYPFPQYYSYKAYPVGSVEEAQAALPDVQGNPVFFYNKGADEVYLKHFNINTGLADFTKFIKETSQPKQDNISELHKKIDYLYEVLTSDMTPTKEVKDDK